MSRIHEQIEALVAFAYRKKLIDVEDLPYARNLLIDALGLDAPADVDAYAPPGRDVPGTATAILDALCDYAAEAGIIPPEPPVRRELFAARLMGLLTPPPSALAERFIALEQARGAREATAWFYRLCRDNNYIRVDDIARNVVFESPSPAGDLIVTINLSKPEKDPKTIALEKSLPASGYPKCMLCVENTGYAGRFNFPARQNHRMLPLMLGGQRWHFQYSPYLYYNEHCIVLNDRHVPMKMGPHTFEAMFDFVDRFEHYFIGSNADLPIVGGSILSHDHYQGGRQAFPMTKAPIAAALAAPRGVRAGILNWPLSSVRLISADRGLLTGLAGRVLEAWREWSDGEFGILAHSKGPDGATSPHNAVTPLLRREGENYVLDLVLRNNRTDGEHPLGIFHPHADLHHIKRENIGLIEVMGMFILPGRLLTELAAVEAAVSAEALPAPTEGLGAEDNPSAGDDLAKHLPWIDDIRARRGVVPAHDAPRVIREELAAKCARVLADCGVYPQTALGRAGMLRFLRTVGLTEAASGSGRPSREGP